MKKSSGNMYRFITHTWNPVRGKCPYNCVYCYAERWGELPPLHLDEKVLNEKLGENNFIFICSGCDLFHPSVPDEWISRVIMQTRKYPNNQYLFHTKNPERVLMWENVLSEYHVLCVTIETERVEWETSKAPPIHKRIKALQCYGGRKMITVEPVMDFSAGRGFGDMIRICEPEQVNIGADSSHKKNKLPEPSARKIELLIGYLQGFTKVYLKKNLRRIFKGIFNDVFNKLKAEDLILYKKDSVFKNVDAEGLMRVYKGGDL